MAAVIDVTAAILTRDDGRILIARKKPGTRNAGLWEFVGGKVEEGETPEACLRRELKEELGIEAVVGPFIDENIHHYPDLSIRLLAYLCRPLTHDITLHDHDEFAWVEKEEMRLYDLAPADIPIIKQLAVSGSEPVKNMSNST